MSLNKQNKALNKTLSKVMFQQFTFVMVCFSGLLGVAILAFRPYYREFGKTELVLMYACLWMLGFLCCIFWFWRKSLKFMNELIDASRHLITEDGTMIQLSTELKEAQDQMNQIKQEAIKNWRLAKKEEQRKNDLIMYLAHDLKTPLTSVIGYLTLLNDEHNISEEVKEHYIEVTLDRAQRLEELINEFFEITRFNLTTQCLEMGHVNMSRMLEQITYEFQPLLEERGLKLKLMAGNDIQINCDINKMERVIDNLIRNAISYSYENSTIEVSAHQQEGSFLFSVLNAGKTIPKEKLEQIFTQFYRMDSSRTTHTGGAGLGLAISKQIVELHHGTIMAESSNEQIKITVVMPLN